MKISASFLSIKDDIKENISKLTDTDIDLLHLDIMDGKFVTNKTFSIDEIKDIINYKKPLDIHLMVSDVYKYIDDFKTLKPEYLTIHYEACDDIMEVISYINKLNIKVGLSIKPKTKIEEIVPYLPFIGLVLLMSVEPGKGGQEFIKETVSKLDKLSSLKGDYLISVDGGINKDTIKLINKADIAVVGSYLTNGNYEENLNKLKESIYG